MSEELNIIFEDKYIIVCYKEAGLAVQTKRITEPDLEHQLLNYCSRNSKQPFLGLIHRLDQPVEGLVMFAKDKKTAAALSATVNDGSTGKYYLAVVEAGLEPGREEWVSLDDYLLKDGRTNTSKVVTSDTAGAKKSHLQYQCLKRGVCEGVEVSLLKIKLGTGRHHQIRVQLSHAGMPIVGDRKYNSKSQLQSISFPALCAQNLSFMHPVSKKLIELECQPRGEIFKLLLDNQE